MRGLHIYKLTLVNKSSLQEKILSFSNQSEGLLLLGLGFLCSVLGAGLHSAVNALSIKSSANDVITHTGKILNTAASDKNNGVLLQVVAYAGDIRRNLDSVCQTNSGKLSESRVGLFGCVGLDDCANTALLGRIVVSHNILLGVKTFSESGSLRLFLKSFSAVAHKLVKGWQVCAPPYK